ncbi:MAG: carboxymuconolactone decarboxylase family protein [Nitratireductor sp.]
MQQRLDYWKTEPALLKAVLELDTAARESGLDIGLVHLVKVRASQINGCSYCVDMHSREARRDGESEQRIRLVSAWRESPLFSPRERAAFEWTERLTRIADGHVTDSDYEAVRGHFSESELVKLTVLIGVINIWNRIAVPFRSVHPVIDDKSRAA